MDSFDRVEARRRGVDALGARGRTRSTSSAPTSRRARVRPWSYCRLEMTIGDIAGLMIVFGSLLPVHANSSRPVMGIEKRKRVM